MNYYDHCVNSNNSNSLKKSYDNSYDVIIHYMTLLPHIIFGYVYIISGYLVYITLLPRIYNYLVYTYNIATSYIYNYLVYTYNITNLI